jgi:hypothetical protein
MSGGDYAGVAWDSWYDYNESVTYGDYGTNCTVKRTKELVEDCSKALEQDISSHSFRNIPAISAHPLVTIDQHLVAISGSG